MKIWTHRVANDDDFAEATFVDASVVKGLRVSARVPLASQWVVPVLRMLDDCAPVDSFSCGPLEIASQRLVDTLKRFVVPPTVEYLPIRVNGSKAPFYAINPIGHVDALDRMSAVYTEESGMVDRISKLALDDKLATDRHLFALDSIQWVWVVSDELAAVLESERIKGLALERPEDWTPY